jgi:hypothetical protein
MAVVDHMDHARALLNGIPALRCSCDLDLLVFFAKHSRALLSSEQLARLLGYELTEIARSLSVLVAAGYLTRSQKQNRVSPARMYVFSTDAMDGGPLSAIVRFASSRDGRLALRLALASSPAALDADAPRLEPKTGARDQMSSERGRVDVGP